MDEKTAIPELKEAVQLVMKGKKRLNSFDLCWSGNKYEETLQLFEKAANIYKLAREWKSAGQVYLDCANLTKEGTDWPLDQAQYLSSAGQCFQEAKEYPQTTLAWADAAQIYRNEGKWSRAGKLFEDLAKIHVRLGDFAGAITFWEKAADCFGIEKPNSISVQGCKIHVADLLIRLNNYKKAKEIYEAVSGMALESETGKWQVGDYLFRAALCAWIIRPDDVKEQLQQYSDLHPLWGSSREYRLLESLHLAFVGDDVKVFENCIAKYEVISKLSDLCVKLLLEVKRILCRERDPSEEKEEDVLKALS